MREMTMLASMRHLRRAASFHEASHCVVSELLGYPVRWAWVNDRRGRFASAGPIDPRDVATVLIAGSLGQRRAEPHSPLGNSDFRALDRICARTTKGNRLWHIALNRAERLVTDHWGAISAVAHGLMRQGRLSGDQVRQIVRRRHAP